MSLLRAMWLFLLAEPSKPFNRCLLCLALILYATYLYGAWFHLPNPYIDEAFFVPVAQAFADGWHFHAPSLDPSRALHWMPVGYAVLSGLFIKITGIDGLWGARLFSSFSFLLIFISLFKISQRLGRLQAVLLYVPFLTMPLLILARIGRMEALFLCLLIWATYALLIKRHATAVGLAVLATLVHPNGIYFLICTGCFFLFYLWGERVDFLRKISRFEWFFLVVCIFLVLSYIGYEMLHLQAFLTDMQYQFERKDRVFLWASPLSLVAFLSMSASAISCVFCPTYGRFVFFAMGSTLMVSRLIGQELWYTPGYLVGLVLVIIAALPSQFAFLITGVQKVVLSRNWSCAASSLLLIGASAIFFISVFGVGWHGARLSFKNYIYPLDPNLEQVDAIEQAIHVSEEDQIGNTVSCVPAAECLLFFKSEKKQGISVQFRNPVTQPPIGRQCIWVARYGYESSSDEDIRLVPGAINRFEVKSCSPHWPGQKEFEYWYYK